MKNKTRLTGPQLAVEYNKILNEYNNLLKAHKKLKKENEELKKDYEALVEDVVPVRQELRDEIENLKGIEKQLWEKLEEKDKIIKLQSVNNRVLLEEIIREREGKK